MAKAKTQAYMCFRCYGETQVPLSWQQPRRSGTVLQLECKACGCTTAHMAQKYVPAPKKKPPNLPIKKPDENKKPQKKSQKNKTIDADERRILALCKTHKLNCTIIVNLAYIKTNIAHWVINFRALPLILYHESVHSKGKLRRYHVQDKYTFDSISQAISYIVQHDIGAAKRMQAEKEQQEKAARILALKRSSMPQRKAEDVAAAKARRRHRIACEKKHKGIQS